ncbi:MAG: hypothetical protein IKO55_13345 [Kiritimatiellae bacterium]|nr:hypothetical protein [Kiritimatiellia bacterium]
MDEDGEFFSMWAHILWQRRGLRMEDFFSMSEQCQLVYIASEILANDQPQNMTDIMVRSLSKLRVKKH